MVVLESIMQISSNFKILQQMFNGGMRMSFYTVSCPSLVRHDVNKKSTQFRTRKSSPSATVQVLSVLKTDENGNLPELKMISGTQRTQSRSQTSSSLLSQKPNMIGVIGGVSVFSTLVFIEKLVWWSLKDGKDCIPFVVCSDPLLSKEISLLDSFYSFGQNCSPIKSNHDLIVNNLKRKTEFLEQAGAGCIVMPCYQLQSWHSEISQSCNLPLLHVGECVARELKEAKLKPLEAGGKIRIGVLALDANFIASFYQENLEDQGFEVVIPDKATMEHIVIPAMEALNRKDKEGARNLLRIAINVLLVRAVNIVILACDEMQGVLPCDDSLLDKCVDPMDSLARAAIKWSKSR